MPSTRVYLYIIVIIISLLIIYKLQIDQPRQTNHKMTRGKVFFYDSMFNTLSLMTHKEVTRLAILIFHVKPLGELELGLTLT